jgi:type IV pilus assembly protein PilQ
VINSLPLRSKPLSGQITRSAAHYLRAALLGLAGVVLYTPVMAATELRDVQFSSLPGNQVRVDLMLSGATKPPAVFSTESPARIALDFEGVKSGLAKKSVPIGIGPVQGLTAIEASDRTRVVINLSDSVPYQVDTKGDRVTIDINATGRTSAAPTIQRATTRPHAAAPSRTITAGIRDIDFQRGSAGQGRVKISLPSSDTPVSVTEKGRHVVVDIANTPLPPRLLRRLDVTDFGTPVVSVESRPKGKDVEVDIQTTNEYDYLAYQADDQFVLEFRPLTQAKKEENRRNKVYSGDRLSLNFQDIEVRAVLQLLADFTGLNLIASDTVRGNITLRLKNVPWDQALDIILKSKGLSMRQTGNVIMVAPTQEIVAQEKLELQADNEIQELAPLRSEFIQVNYAKASELAGILKSPENKLLSERGAVTVDARTNTLLVQDTVAKLEDIRRIVGELDVPVRQVMIESRVVIANNDFARDLGVRFGYTGYNTSSESSKGYGAVTGGTQNALQPNPWSGPVDPNTSQYPQTLIGDTLPLMVNLPVTAPSGVASFLLGKVGSYLLQLELSAMQTEGRGEIISSPRVITSDQHKATIKVGQEIPYQESSASGRTTVAFKEAVLQLDVTPHITPDDRVIMDLRVNKDAPDYSRSINGTPPLDTRSVDTSVLVDNGETVVLGGVYERTKAFNKEQVPWLGDLPIVGNLFKRTERTDNNTELLIFVTPKILKQELVKR